MKTRPFIITPYSNRNGSTSWRVTGWLFGVRIRRNFPTKVEAASEKSCLEIRAMQAETGLRPVLTILTEAQVREAEDLFRRLRDGRISLTAYFEFALRHYQEPNYSCNLERAIAEYVESKRREMGKGILSPSHFEIIHRHLRVLQVTFPGSSCSDLTVKQMTEYCDRGKVSLKTYNNRRGTLSTFFKFVRANDWTIGNPIEKVPYYRIAHRRGSAATIDANTASELMAFVEEFQSGRLVPFFALCLFAGIRPCLRAGEISRLKPEHVRLDTEVIHIEPEVSKVKMKRNITIQPNLLNWLQTYPLEHFPITFPHLRKYRADVCRRFKLSHDIMRHTFISMFVAKYRSMGEAALQAGNSESIIRKHYIDLKTKEEAERFFGILPRLREPSLDAQRTA